MTGNNDKIKIQNHDGYYHRTTCRICGSKKVEKFISLGPTPLANSLLTENDLRGREKTYPLDVYFCTECNLVQLMDVVSPERMFSDYVYMTGASKPMQTHFLSLVSDAIGHSDPEKSNFVVDIGSNDGTLLNVFSQSGCKTLGIEPATNLVAVAQTRGIQTINTFFNKKTAEKVFQEYGPADIITATNVFAHIDDLHGIIEGITCLLAERGTFIIEVPYLYHLIERLEFDTIYHEHLSYFSLHPLVYLFRKHGLTVVDVREIGSHGGSIRVFIRKQGLPTENVKKMLQFEKTEKLDDPLTYEKFGIDVAKLKRKLRSLLKKLKKDGCRITAYGATAKGNTLLNYCKIGTEYLDYISDTTPLKQGKYSPGMHIPIVPEEVFHESPPDYALLLAWNYAEEILRKESSYRKNGGKFIHPIPTPEIV